MGNGSMAQGRAPVILGSHRGPHCGGVTWERSCLGTGVPGTGDTEVCHFPATLRQAVESCLDLTPHKPEMETSPEAVSLLCHHCAMAPDDG